MLSTSVHYLHNSFESARKKKLENAFIFYLQLKQLNPSGFIEGRNYIKHLSAHFSYSNGQISNLFNKLKKLGWINEWKRADGAIWRYQIVSIRKVYNELGFRFKKRNNEYRFTSLNILGKKKAEIKALIQSSEIKNNLHSQIFRTVVKIESKIKYHTKKLKQELKKDIQKSIESRTKKINDLKQLLKDISQNESTNISGLISYKKIAKIMGYKSISTISKINKQSNKDRLVKICKTRIILASRVKFFDWLKNFDPKKTYWIKGTVVQQKCNQYFFDLKQFPNKHINISNDLLND